MINKILFGAIFFLPLTVVSQKTAPVAGDAATIINLLKKDYGAVNPETREDEFAADRGKIIGLFTAYLTLSDETKQNIKIVTTSLTQYDTAYSSYTKLQQQLNSVLGSVAATDKTVILNLEHKRYEAKQSYLTKKYNFDMLVMEKLIAAYGKDPNSNPFIVTLLTRFKDKYTLVNSNQADYFIENNSAASIQKGLPLLGGSLGFSTSDLVDGLSRFLAKRIKQELANYAMSKIQEYLNKPLPENYCYELLALLPQTTAYLKKYDPDLILNFPNQLKATIEQDMNTLLTNAASLKDTPRFRKAIANNPNLGFAFEALEMLPRLSEITSPIEYFEILDKSETLNKWRHDAAASNAQFNTAQAVKFFTMMAYSLTTIENGEQRFVTVDFIASYGSRDEFMLAYLGLLRQQEKKYYDIAFKASAATYPLELNKLMQVDATRKDAIYRLVRSSLSNIIQNTDKMYHQGASIRKKNKNGEPLDFKEIHSFISEILTFSERTIKNSNALIKGLDEALKQGDVAFPVSQLTFPATFQSYLQVAGSANDIVLDLHQKEFSSAINRALAIPLKMSPDATPELVVVDFANYDDLVRLGSMFALPASGSAGDSANIVASWKSHSNFLELYGLKLQKVPGLVETGSKMREMATAIAMLEDNSLYSIAPALARLKTSIRANIPSVLRQAGVDTEEIIEEMEKQWEGKVRDKVTREFLRNKTRSYIELSFKRNILNEKTEAAEEQQLGELLKEYSNAHNASGTVDSATLRIINFISDIAVSEKPEDIQTAIEAFALPVGSSSLKEKTTSYFSINSYPGLLGGGEYTEDSANAGFIGFTAPVGFYYQPFASRKNGGSLGFFFPLIDIAAPVRFRLDSEKDNESLPDYEIKDIFAPGIYLTYGFGKSPFAINLGIQYGPKLRDDFGSRDSYRVGLGLVIDIPLLTLSNRYTD